MQLMHTDDTEDDHQEWKPSLSRKFIIYSSNYHFT